MYALYYALPSFVLRYSVMTMKSLAIKAKSQGFLKTMKEEFKNTEGKVNMARLGIEAIGILF